jgi:hypothetical protein
MSEWSLAIVMPCLAPDIFIRQFPKAPILNAKYVTSPWTYLEYESEISSYSFLLNCKFLARYSRHMEADCHGRNIPKLALSFDNPQPVIFS